MEKKKISVNLNVDTTPILFTDGIFMTTNEDGVTLEITQKIFGEQQKKIVSRIGMSRSHAKKFVKELSKLLAVTEGNTESGKNN